MTQHQIELDKFITLQNLFLKQAGTEALDRYGFTTTKKPDIFFTALTHGNEVIGLQVVNLFLEKAILLKPAFSFAVQLNNIEAYNKNERFIDKDLNRSFKSTLDVSKIEKNQEYHRALEIEAIVKKLQPRFVLDLHQTTEPTMSPFFMLPEDETLILAASALNPEWPIISFDGSGFSKDGKTLMEFSWSEKIPALVIEISQNGFNLELAQTVADRLFNLNPSTIINPAKKSNVDYFKITQQITKHSLGSALNPGFKNLQAINENEIIGLAPNGDKHLCPASGLFIFPKYGRQAEVSHELGLIATPFKLQTKN
jgi:succinylglutamate desuccinylase